MPYAKDYILIISFTGDVRFHWFFAEESCQVQVKNALWWMWLNVSMLEVNCPNKECTLNFPRAKIDGAHKRKHEKKYPESFGAAFQFKRE